MRSGNASRRRRSVSAFAAALLCARVVGAQAGSDAAPDLEAVMADFARSRGVEATFREEKSLPLLVSPLVSEGVLYYAPPQRMVRFTTEPEPTSLLVVGDRLRMQDSLGVEEIDLAAFGTARQFVDQLLVLFQGDLVALRERYELEFEWRDGAWALTLTPKSRRMRGVIQEIALSGRDRALEAMVVTGAAGDVTRTTYERVDTDRSFRDEELAALFPSEGAPHMLAGRDGAAGADVGPDASHP
jgi:outer membrane lipoprotein-sorting protein